MINAWLMLRVAAERQRDLIAQAYRTCWATASRRWLPTRMYVRPATARACVGSC
jgi:hypothetical protein